MKTFRAIIDLWESHQELWRDLRAQGVELNKMSVSKWYRRDYIPANHWAAVLAAAAARNLDVTEAQLVGALKIAEARRARERTDRAALKAATTDADDDRLSLCDTS
jgi:hypothetical protein